jgi:hypothetical protein
MRNGRVQSYAVTEQPTGQQDESCVRRSPTIHAVSRASGVVKPLPLP